MRLNHHVRPRLDRGAAGDHHRDEPATGTSAPQRIHRAHSGTGSGQVGTPPTSTHTAGRHRESRRRLVVIAGLVALAVVLTGSGASAEAAQVPAQAESVEQVLTNLRTWVMGILAGLATLFLTIGGVRYVMANGDPGEIEKAKTALRGAGIGYGLAALAPLVVTVLQGIVGA